MARRLSFLRLSLTFFSAAEKVLVDLLHALQVDAADLRVVHHGLGVVHSYHALCLLLGFLRGPPGVVDVFGREVFQYWQITSGSTNGREKKTACDGWLNIRATLNFISLKCLQS